MAEQIERKVYLGDSVYAEFSGHDITLTTENGFGPTNTIVLDSEVYQELVRYVHRIGWADTALDNLDRIMRDLKEVVDRWVATRNSG